MVPPGVQKLTCDIMRNSTWVYPYVPTEDLFANPLSDMENGEVSRLDLVLQQAFEKIPGDSWQAKLDSCAACKCCTRHQTFRPRRLVPWTEDMANRDIKIHYTSPKCECDCRHMARFICRQVETKCPLESPILEDKM